MQPLPTTLPAFFWHFLRPRIWAFAFIVLSFLAWPINDMIIPYILSRLVDVLQKMGPGAPDWLDTLMPYFGLVVGLFVMNEVMFRLHDWLIARTIPAFRTQVTREVADYALGHSHRYFSEHFTGSIANRVSKLSTSMSAIIFDFVQNFIPVVISVALAFGLMWGVSPLFSLLLLGWFTLYMAAVWGLTRRCEYYSHRHSDRVTELQGRVVDLFTNITSMRLFARGRYERAYLDRSLEGERETSQATLMFIFRMKIVLGLITFGGAVVWWVMVLYYWQQGWITVGQVTQLIIQQWAITGFSWYMGLRFLTFFEEVGVCKEALDLIATPQEVVDAEAAVPLAVTRGEIRFDQVRFHYIPGKDIFRDKNLTIQAGEKVGLVGFSGSGKSTFVNLILRLYDVEEGRILIDGQDIARVTQESLRAAIAVVPQDTMLFHRTLRENIRYGRPEASDAEVEEAARRAYCEGFIRELPEGYEALVGERGVKLSGGQRQRIAVARAILKNAPILMLDEATSALDSVTEREIQDSLYALMEGRTTIVIAHRLSTLAKMDRLLVFKEGEIIEDGTPAALLAQNGHYAMLWRMQADGFLPDAGKPALAGT